MNMLLNLGNVLFIFTKKTKIKQQLKEFTIAGFRALIEECRKALWCNVFHSLTHILLVYRTLYPNALKMQYPESHYQPWFKENMHKFKPP